MPSQTRTSLLEAARDTIRRKGFAATSVDDLCQATGVTKGAYFHHFRSKEAMGVAAAEFWSETTGALFDQADYHRHDDPLDRVLAYLDFRRSLIAGDLAGFTCLLGTLAQEAHDTSPAIRDAAGQGISGHADTLVADISAAMERLNTPPDWTAESLALHTQVVLQGAFVVAKALNDPEPAREAIDHLERYVRHLFGVPDSREE